MRERGKGVDDVYGGGDQNLFQDYSFSSDLLPCKKHPQSCSVGICPFCLRDRLVKLVCSDCGEQRLSSCSCSDELSSNPRTSGAGGEVGSVGRVSFLLENENKDQLLAPGRSSSSKPKTEEVLVLKRSSSSCVEIKRKNGFWRIGRFFRKRKDQKSVGGGGGGGFDDQRSDLWVVDHVGGHVSRSRSLCSFRGNSNGVFGSEDGVDLMSFSGARSSISAARSSSVNGGGLGFDPGRKSGFSEAAEPRKSGFSEAEPRRSGCSERRDSTFMESDVETRTVGCNRKVFSLGTGDEPGFIDLKFELPSEFPKPDVKTSYNWGFDPVSAFGSMRQENESSAPDPDGGYRESFAGRDGRFGSCRITVNERGIKKSRKSFKGWRWIFKHHDQNGISMREKGRDSQMRV